MSRCKIRPELTELILSLFANFQPSTMADYESETTRFLRDLLNKHPELEAQQRALRATWWDRKLDADLQQRFMAAEEPKPAYAYFPVPKATKPGA